MIFLEKQIATLKNGTEWPVLVPFENDGYEKVQKMKDRQKVRVEAKRARNYEHHKKFFAILNAVYQNQEQFKSADDLREATLIEAGYTELRERFNGERYHIARSIAFDALDQDGFEPLYSRCLDLWCEHFGWQRDVLENVGGEAGYRRKRLAAMTDHQKIAYRYWAKVKGRSFNAPQT